MSISSSRLARVTVGASLLGALAACGASDDTGPTETPGNIQFTAASVHSLDSTGQVIVQANPTNSTLKSLVDSTLGVLTAGVQAKRIDVTTNLTSAPLYFVGIHRAIARASGSFSTWTVVGIDDPSHLANLIEVSGFAENTSATPPSSVSGDIGSTFVNALMLQVGSGGAVSQWNAGTGTVSFSSDAPGAACPGFTPIPNISCALETMHVRFSANASNGGNGAGARQASVATVVDIPAMRLTYTP